MCREFLTLLDSKVQKYISIKYIYPISPKNNIVKQKPFTFTFNSIKII